MNFINIRSSIHSQHRECIQNWGPFQLQLVRKANPVSQTSNYLMNTQMKAKSQKRKGLCSTKKIVVSVLFSISFIVGLGFLCHYLGKGMNNEWKNLKYAIKRNHRTERFFLVIDRYENAASALHGGNEGEIKIAKIGEKVNLRAENPTGDTVRAKIVIHEGGWIHELLFHNLEDDDILDLSYLPKNLRDLYFHYGKVTSIDMGKLPRSLERLGLKENGISKLVVEFAPPLLSNLFLENNPLEAKGVTLKVPFPKHLTMHLPAISAVNLESRYLQRGHWEKYWIANLQDGTKVDIFETGFTGSNY